jgi:hypothetical protein
MALKSCLKAQGMMHESDEGKPAAMLGRYLRHDAERQAVNHCGQLVGQ